MKRYEEARPAYKKAIAINPQEGDSWFIGAACREAQSHLPGAMYGYRQFLGLTPGPDPRKQTVQRNIERWRQQGIKEDPSDF
jgi:tetratricopeptide (TPR) repeat protein